MDLLYVLYSIWQLKIIKGELIFATHCYRNRIKRPVEQQIKEPTCQTGSLIDHIYVNNSMKLKEVFTGIDAVYYSDHDTISLYIPKEE